MSETLAAIAADADLILTGTTYQEVAANVAEHHGIPLAALHYFPGQGQFQNPAGAAAHEHRPSGVGGGGVGTLASAQAHRGRAARTLGLPRARHRAVRRIVESGALEIQAYDEVFFRPGRRLGQSRPLVGSMTLQLPAEVDDDVSAWVAEGHRRSTSVSAACRLTTRRGRRDDQRRLGRTRRASPDLLGCAGNRRYPGGRPREGRPHGQPRAIFPDAAPSSTTAVPAPPPPASARGSDPGAVGRSRPAGVGKGRPAPGVGTSRRFSATTARSLREDLTTVLSANCTHTAREVAARMTPPATSVARAADLLEQAAAR